MRNLNLRLAFVLFILGFLGIISILASEIRLPEEQMALIPENLEDYLPFLLLIQPTVLLLFALLLGLLLAPPIGLASPLIEGLLNRQPVGDIFRQQLIYGVLGGLIGGGLIVGLSALFSSYIPKELIDMQARLEPSLWTRFLYGGITEEILLRWGMMTFIVWLIWRIAMRRRQPADWVYVAGIVGSALLFGAGHLPIVFGLSESVHAGTIIYIVGLNSLFGLIAGWLFWKKGLEAAMIAHISAHVVMVLLA